MGDVTRRVVLGAGAGIAGLVALGSGEGAAEAAPIATSAPLRRHYKKSVGRIFTATHAGRTVRLRLTHIRDLSPTKAKQRQHSFTLVFTPVGKAHVPDAIYVMRTHGLQPHRLFVSSMGPNRGLQAVVNRPV
jgi:hypothetical protein